MQTTPLMNTTASIGDDTFAAQAAPRRATTDFTAAQRTLTDPSRLAPEDAFGAQSPPRRQGAKQAVTRWNDSSERAWSLGDTRTNGSANGDHEPTPSHASSLSRRHRDKPRKHSGSRRRKGVWKKLLWVKQSYPDNYTDAPTFLSHLQWNPLYQPYEFWPLFADSMVIVQHVCSVAIFVCCFVGIYQGYISPVSVVSSGSAGTVLCWLLWDTWIGQEEHARTLHAPDMATTDDQTADDIASVSSTLHSQSAMNMHGLGLTLSSSTMSMNASRSHSRNISSTSLQALSPLSSPTSSLHPPNYNNNGFLMSSHNSLPPYESSPSLFSVRTQQRLATVKSALLIYTALLGLSPVLKSLTQSTSKDSIWAMSSWLICINVFFFDYSGGAGPGSSPGTGPISGAGTFPASLSTNAALMASTVLASRLPTITHVFSLTLFSIEIFGLFPLFRRHLRGRSWNLHVLLTVLLIVGAGAGLGLTLAGDSSRTWTAAVLGVVIWGLGTTLAMGGCSWWLISLQRYKHVVIGPWDPARPVIRARGWE